MKNGFWDRVLIFLYVLLTAALTVLTALQAFGIDLITVFYAGLEAQAPGLLWKLVVSGLGAIVVLLGVFVLMAIRPVRRAAREFITLTNDENGQVKIALPALREMARQAVGDAAGLNDMAVDISESGDAITVAISLDVVSGTHLPTVTMNMQRAVRSYIQMNCGVAVKDVSVTINSVLPAPEGAKDETVPACEPTAEPAPAAEPVREEAFEPDSAFEPETLPDESPAEVEEQPEAGTPAEEKQ